MRVSRPLSWSLLVTLAASLGWAEEMPRLDVIHKPKTGCSPDRVEVRGLFLELNGSREDACVAHSTLNRPDLNHADVSYDYLAVGESIEFELVTPQQRQSDNRDQSPVRDRTK
jgi:hypothetical protein